MDESFCISALLNFLLPNSMLTNFHLPKSSLIIMVCAFGGYDLIMKAYEEAIKEKCRTTAMGMRC